MDPTILFMLGGAAIGGAMADSARSKESLQAFQNMERQRWINEQALKNKAKGKQIAEGNLTLGALGNTSNSREQAMKAFQANSAEESALGLSGMSSGTPFYKLAQDIRDNNQRLMEGDFAGRLQMENQKASIGLSMKQDTVGIAQGEWALAGLAGEYAYTSGLEGGLMALATGVIEGASTGAKILTQVETMVGKDSASWFTKTPDVGTTVPKSADYGSKPKENPAVPALASPSHLDSNIYSQGGQFSWGGLFNPPAAEEPWNSPLSNSYIPPTPLPNTPWAPSQGTSMPFAPVFGPQAAPTQGFQFGPIASPWQGSPLVNKAKRTQAYSYLTF